MKGKVSDSQSRSRNTPFFSTLELHFKKKKEKSEGQSVQSIHAENVTTPTNLI